MDACLHRLYNEFQYGKKYLDQQNDYIIRRQVLENESMFPACLHKKSRYFSDNIKHKIINEGAYLLSSSCRMLGKDFNVNVIICNAIEYVNVEKIFFTIFLWLYVISVITTDNSSTCSRTLDITLFLVDVPKELPIMGSETIGPEHVNSGYTYTCKENNEIVIYREEEWLKVLIHESFHAYGLDFSAFNMDQYQERIRKLFNINVELLIYESYCETWARLLNVMINHFIEQPSIKFTTFKKKCITDFQKETVHSIVQACKILKFMGLSYTIITTSDKKLKACSLTLYKENTNVFCYYIITALLMFYADDLFKWCGDNNYDYLCIPKNTKNIIKFIEFIEKRYKTEEFVELMDDCLDMDELRDPTLRMSSFFVDMAK
jgi:hypothetical protein